MNQQQKMTYILIGFLVIFAAVLIFVRPQPKPIEQSDFKIFFNQERGSETLTEAVVRKFPVDKATQKEILIERKVKWALEKLMEGPSADEVKQGYFTEIPKGVGVKKVFAKDNELVVELSAEFDQGSGSHNIQQRLAQLVNTLEAVPDNHYAVHIQIEGKPMTLLGSEGLEVPDPLVPAKK